MIKYFEYFLVKMPILSSVFIYRKLWGLVRLILFYISFVCLGERHNEIYVMISTASIFHDPQRF